MICTCKTCRIEILTPTDNQLPHIVKSTFRNDQNYKRAGVVVYNSQTNKFLLVQSHGKLWGFAKGRMEPGERVRDAAVRELYEETGITIKTSDLESVICVHNNAMYYLYDTTKELGNVPLNDIEINGLMWIDLNCLIDLVNTEHIKLNSHCKYNLNNHFKMDKV